MKLALFLLLCATASASPILTVTGAATPVADAWMLDLLNQRGTANDRTVTITSDVMLSSITFTADNSPNAPGSGLVIYTDGVLRLNTGGWGGLVLGPISLTGDFREMRIETNEQPGYREHALVTGLVGIAAVPEPSVFALACLGMFGVWMTGLRGRRGA